MKAKIEKWQEPPPAKTVKPMSLPDGGSKKRRGGRRLRCVDKKLCFLLEIFDTVFSYCIHPLNP